jgi:hypothetical protein
MSKTKTLILLITKIEDGILRVFLLTIIICC